MIDWFSFFLGLLTFLIIELAILAYHIKKKIGSNNEKSIEELEKEGWET